MVYCAVQVINTQFPDDVLLLLHSSTLVKFMLLTNNRLGFVSLGMRLVWFLCLMPSLALAQLKEFEVSAMERPDVAVVQANTQFPDDAMLFVYASLKDLNFRSSLGGIDKVSYNTQANRYEILFKPNKQILFVYASNFVEQKIETFNPNPKDVFYYKVEQKQESEKLQPGFIKINSEPEGCKIMLNK